MDFNDYTPFLFFSQKAHQPLLSPEWESIHNIIEYWELFYNLSFDMHSTSGEVERAKTS